MFKRADAYGRHLNSYDALKLVALFTMVIDHVGAYLLPEAEILRAVGRIAFPLFLFLTGYSRRWQFRGDILLWGALVALTAAHTHHNVFPLNVLFGIAFARAVLGQLARLRITPEGLAALVIACLVWYPLLIWLDYSSFNVLFAVAGYLQRQAPRARSTLVFLYVVIALHFFVQQAVFQFHPIAFYCMLASTAIVAWLMHRFTLEPVPEKLPSALRRALLWAARNTLPLYALHLAALMAMEWQWFPERLMPGH